MYCKKCSKEMIEVMVGKVGVYYGYSQEFYWCNYCGTIYQVLGDDGEWFFLKEEE